MKKVLALVLAAVMALSLAATASALEIIPGGATPDKIVEDAPDSFFFVFGGDGNTYETLLTPGGDFVADAEDENLFAVDTSIAAVKDDPETEGVDESAPAIPGDKYTISATASSSKPDIMKATIATKTIKNDDGSKAMKITLKLDPADEYFTVEDQKVTVKVVVVQKESVANGDNFKVELEWKDLIVKNDAHFADEFYTDADNKVSSVATLSKPVIDDEVFTDAAKDKALTLEYSDYSVKFAKVSKQNTSLYLKAKTGVVSVENTKAIASIGFKPTRVKDAATITMPISYDNQNLYGETVYVYNVVDGKPTGEAIAAEVVNHNSVIFTVPAGTTLGTFAAYGDKAQGDAEKPAIPETGANDIVNIAIVFAVVALAAAGFVAVKKASK